MYISTVVVLLYLIDLTGALECYSCANIQDPNECNNTVTCGADEFCSHATVPGGSGKTYSLGCGNNNKCGVNNTGPGAIVGRDLEIRQTLECHECCSFDLCNKNLCIHLIPSDCVDDVNFDCARLKTVFQICKDKDHAKNTCPRFCNLCNVVDGNWSPWSSWSHCDVTCGNGTEARVRSCTNPRPANGGYNCLGNNKITKLCERQLCPVHGGWSEWSEFGQCSVTCGMGMTKRLRSCSKPPPSRFGDHCFGDRVEYTLCMPKPCTDGRWSDWEPWSNCTSCDKGIHTRTRNCNRPKPSPYGNYCTGQSLQVEACNSYCSDCRDCYDIKRKYPDHQSGIYVIKLWKSKKLVSVFCDMDTDNGGWTVFQNRFDGSVDFYRNYTNYTNGFGDLTGEFWLGLENLHEMTSHGSSELRVDVKRANGFAAYEVFKNFSISSSPDYILRVSPGNGTADNMMIVLV
ncbi:SCO-spondin-like [Mercenaria mercenaria]|uniref:SCO-spondin-like n=1 Tax=Mercenaria mercenaria TaxID=6596 RepID=UPI00234F51C5|nr:SCO-spondin-like [Mercenaria mercenaria]